MTPAFSLVKHDPDNGKYGDCYRAAIASLLDLKTEAVPHVYDSETQDAQEQRVAMDEWLFFHQGLCTAMILFPGTTSKDEILGTIAACNPGRYYLFGGKSRNGTGHIVVCYADKIVHDPNPGADIVAPGSNGYYEIQFLISAKHWQPPPLVAVQVA